jgi:hypothetical protein
MAINHERGQGSARTLAPAEEKEVANNIFVAIRKH